MTSADHSLKTLLDAAGIAPEPFVKQLQGRATPEMFMAGVEKAFGGEAKPEAALSLRALHLQSGNAARTFQLINQVATLRDPEVGTLRKLATRLSAIGNARDLSKHYAGIGLTDIAKHATGLGAATLRSTAPSDKKFAWPKFTFDAKGNKVGERAIDAVEEILKKFSSDGKNSPARNTGQFFDLSETSIRGIAQAAQNILKDPQIRAHILTTVQQKTTSKGLEGIAANEVHLVLNEVLGAVGKFHNPADTKRLADAISIASGADKSQPLEMLTQYWKAATTPLTSGIEHAESSVAPLVDAVEKEIVTHKIAFANKPLVNLGAAAAAIGGAVFVGNHFGKPKEATTESVDGQGTKTIHTQTIPAGFWVKTAKFVGMTGLLAASGVALFRGGALPNAEGMSFAERMLTRKATAKVATVAAV